jgi:hypothetical protein
MCGGLSGNGQGSDSGLKEGVHLVDVDSAFLARTRRPRASPGRGRERGSRHGRRFRTRFRRRRTFETSGNTKITMGSWMLGDRVRLRGSRRKDADNIVRHNVEIVDVITGKDSGVFQH